MRAVRAALLALATASAFLAGSRPAAGQVSPLVRAYAHNDYRHARPLLDALEHGFDAVEADVHLVGGRLLVAHDSSELAAAPTLEALYLVPLRERVRRNGGAVQPDMPPLLLLVDVKSEAEGAYQALEMLLGRYADMLTRFTRDSVAWGPVWVVVSGHRARAAMAAEPSRLAAYDARFEELDEREPPPPALMPLVSDEWQRVSAWKGAGAMPARERAALERRVERAHAQGRKLRVWGAPDRPSVWGALYDAGVDYVSTDDLDGLRRFLLRRR